jgi:hypothetical protein
MKTKLLNFKKINSDQERKNSLIKRAKYSYPFLSS